MAPMTVNRFMAASAAPLTSRAYREILEEASPSTIRPITGSSDVSHEVYNGLFERHANSQPDSPLFTKLPTEVRQMIFRFALARDSDKVTGTGSTRPSYAGSCDTDDRLLLTCHAVFIECWHLTPSVTEPTFWLAPEGSVPPNYNISASMRRSYRRLGRVMKVFGKADKFKMDHMRVFAHMPKLERGEMAKLLAMPRLLPRTLTITVRHTDWWVWDFNAPLGFDGHWTTAAAKAMPESVQEVRIEMETLERKKEQVDALAELMCRRWFLKLQNGTVLYPDASGKSNEVERWMGESHWDKRRWPQDEVPGRRRLDYYIQRVVFQREDVVVQKGGSIDDQTRDIAEKSEMGKRDRLDLRLDIPTRSYSNRELLLGGEPSVCHSGLCNTRRRPRGPESQDDLVQLEDYIIRRRWHS